jgi:aminoglycoside phosphotransferase
MTALTDPPVTPPAARAAGRDLDLLTGADAGAALTIGVAAAGGSLLSWRPRLVQECRGGAVAAYAVKVRWADGRVRDETFAATTADRPDGTLVLDGGDRHIAMWRLPHDPDLPGLAAATDAHTVARVLEGFGLGGGPVRLTVRAYRPRRRAVIEATGSAGRLFVKAVRPELVQQIHERHRGLVAAGVPVPHSLGFTDDGLLILQALGGRTMREALRSPTPRLPDGAAITAMLDRLPIEAATSGRRRSWLDRVEHYAGSVASVLPERADQVRGIAAAISAEAGTGPTVAVHGDFYESQLLLTGRSITGLLDIDTLRLGDRLDDLGCLIGHLAVLAHLEPQHAAAIRRAGEAYLAAFERTVDPADLRYRTAAVVISLATGPHRVQQPRWPATTRRLVDLAGEWLASARAVRAGA